MAMASVMGIVGLIVYLFVIMFPIGLLVLLQVWLCKKSVRLGLILPGISLVLSMVLVFSMAAFGRIGGGALRVTDENGNVIQEETIKAPPIKAGEVVAVGLVFLVSNIPTVVFGGVWLHYKGRKDTLDDLKRMRIEDLE
jgi:hypothetical protein